MKKRNVPVGKVSRAVLLGSGHSEMELHGKIDYEKIFEKKQPFKGIALEDYV